jgi:nitroreductase
VEEEKILKVLEAARVAPSAHNYQPYTFVVVRNPEMRENIASTYQYGWLKQAPVILVVLGDHSKSWRRTDGKDHCDIDAAIAIDHLTLQAAELGLGTCWICMFNSMECHRILDLPGHMEAVALIPLGYPAREGNRDRHDRDRRPLSDLARWL